MRHPVSVILRGAADAERSKLHLPPNVFAEHQGVHCRDLRKQELLKIVKIKEKCEIYSQQNLLAKVWQKAREKHSISLIFNSFCTTRRRMYIYPYEG